LFHKKDQRRIIDHNNLADGLQRQFFSHELKSRKGANTGKIIFVHGTVHFKRHEGYLEKYV